MSEFLAESRIIVRPDTTQFRAQLEAQLAAVVAKPITIPVVAAVAPSVGVASGATKAAAASIQEVTAATEAATLQQVKATAATVKLSTAENAAAIAAQKLAFSQQEVVGASSAVSAAQIALTRATAAVAAAQRAVGLATRANNASLVASTEETLALAAAQQVEATSALETARAEAKLAAARAQGLKGVIAQGAALLGLRAGTLAASSAFIAATVGVLGFAKAVKSAAALETELNVFQANASATADQMKRVSDEAKQLGRDLTLPGVTANDAAQAMTELAKAGLSVRDSMAAARGTLQLATAAQISNSEAAQLVSGALNSFELSGRNATKVADLFAGAAKSAQGSIQDFGPALAQVSAVAHGFGISIEDTITLLTQLAKAGIQGGRAGTALRVALLRLGATKEAEKTLKGLNVQLRDAQGNVRPQVFADLQVALDKLSVSQRALVSRTLLGTDAIRTQLVLGKQGVAGFNEINRSVTETGLAQEQAAARTKGLQGDFENLSNQASSLGLTIGELAKGPTSELVKGLAEIVSETDQALTGLTSLAHEISSFTDDLGGAVPQLDKFNFGLSDVIGALAKFNPINAQMKELNFLLGALGVNAKKAGDGTDTLGAIADSVAASLNGLADALGRIRAEATPQIPADTGRNIKQIQNIIGGFEAKQVRDKIAHDNNQLLADLRAEQDFLVKQLQRDYVKKRPALRAALEQTLLGVVNEIDSIQAKAAADTKAANDKAKKLITDAAAAATKREQALLAAQGLARDQRQNRIDEAALTKPLTDDIAQQKKLRALVEEQIRQVRLRISVEGGRAVAITALNAILNQIKGRLKDLTDAQQQAAAEQRQNLIQSAQLDVDFAQIVGNPQAEIAARKRLIAQLQEQQRLVAKGTLAYKDLRNQIGEQNKAIADLTAEKQKQNGALGQAEFEFLQAQQGFAANLLGNLIPRGATAGLVGNPVQSALTPVAGAAEAQARSGPTAGQGQLTNTILRAILDQLKELNGEQKAPEARRQMTWQSATFDGPGVGWGGG